MEERGKLVNTAETRSIEKRICQEIKDAESDLRKRYSLLKYQDALGSSVFLISLAGIYLFSLYYFHHRGSFSHAFLSMVGIAFCVSFLHELEHDLIHNLYWKKFPIIQDVMFFGIMLAKMHSNPWFRREMHLKHHVVSGQKDDAEERLIGLGLPFSWKRLAVSIHPFGALIVTKEVAEDSSWLNVQRMNLSSAPIAFVFFGLQKAFMAFYITHLLLPNIYFHYFPIQYWEIIRDLNILFCFPNIWRQFCIVLMSNCSHYYGDIPDKSVFYQNQILNHWIFWPFQLFCFNFGKIEFIYATRFLILHSICPGATHVVHHYVPGQTFYMRQLVYSMVNKDMIRLGVRVNDMAIVSRGNRYRVSEKRVILSSLPVWTLLCMSVGYVSYVFIDQMVLFSLFRRIYSKYIPFFKERSYLSR